jgi:hypothetical protein
MTGPLISTEEHFVSSPLDDGLLIARPADDRLFLFNGTARYIWERLVEGAGESELPGLMAAHYGIDLAQARNDVTDTLQRWRQDGLVRACGIHRRYKVAGLAFDIRHHDAATANVLGPMLAHLESDTARHSALELDLNCRDGAIVLRANGVEIGRAKDWSALIEVLLSELFRSVIDKTDWTMSLHAAAVATAGACVLMPGASGAGKSSLTAALSSLDGMQFVADDLALLAGATLDVVPVPLPIVLKSGAWDALHAILPGLAARTVYRRFGRECRYWTPPLERIAREPMPVKAIVFPRYVQGTATALTPVPALDAFGRITAAPSAVRPPITRDTLEALAQFARDVPAYSLTYGSLADARWIIRDLLLT